MERHAGPHAAAEVGGLQDAAVPGIDKEVLWGRTKGISVDDGELWEGGCGAKVGGQGQCVDVKVDIKLEVEAHVKLEVKADVKLEVNLDVKAKVDLDVEVDVRREVNLDIKADLTLDVE